LVSSTTAFVETSAFVDVGGVLVTE
jgi:hypothetical protein